MRRVDYNQILQPLTELYGETYAEADSELQLRFKNFISRRLREAWEDAHWPDLVRVEKRRFANAYLDSVTYYNGDFVYYPPTGAYYQCLVTQQGNAPVDASDNVQAAYWVKAGVSWSGSKWVTGTSYAVGDVVFYRPANLWFQCIQATSSKSPGDVSDGWNYWGALRVFRKVFAGQPTESAPATTAGAYADPWVSLTLAEDIELKIGDRIVVAGVTPAEYNGEFAVAHNTSPRIIQYAPGADPGTYSGAGTVRKIYEEPGLLKAVYDRDPQAFTTWAELEFEQVNTGWLVPQAPAEVWVEFRQKAPLLTGAAYSATATYTAGEQILFNSSGSIKNFYECKVATSAGESPTTDPMKWALIEIPYIFQTFLVYGALSDALKMDGNHAAAGAQLKIARESLEEEQIKQWNLQPQRNRVAVTA